MYVTSSSLSTLSFLFECSSYIIVSSDSVTCALYSFHTCFFFLPITVVSYVRKLHKRKPCLFYNLPHTHTQYLQGTLSPEIIQERRALLFHAMLLPWLAGVWNRVILKSVVCLLCLFIPFWQRRREVLSVPFSNFSHNTFLLATAKESLFILNTYMYFCVTLGIVGGKSFLFLLSKYQFHWI